MKIHLSIFLLACCLVTWGPRAEAQVPTSIIYVSDYADCVDQDPVEVHFSTDNTGIASWWWDFGNNQQSTSASPAADYDAPGSYDVTLTVDTLRWGPMTVVAEDLVQINRHVFEDDFEEPSQSLTYWGNLSEDLIVNGALEFEVMVKTGEQQSGEIICLNGGGRNPPLSSGRFYFDLELIREDPRFVSYTPFRLLDSSSMPLAGLRIRRTNKDFEVGIEDIPGSSTTWHSLVHENPTLSVQVDWYHENGFGGLTFQVQEDSEPAFVQELPLSSQSNLADLQIGIIDIDWPDDGTRHGKLRLDNFRVCEFEHRPAP